MSAMATVNLYINDVAVNVDNLNKKQSAEFRRALLTVLKPANKHLYLELDLDAHEEHGILTCTNEDDAIVCLPPEVVSRVNKFVYVPVVSEWNPTSRITVLMSLM